MYGVVGDRSEDRSLGKVAGHFCRRTLANVGMILREGQSRGVEDRDERSSREGRIEEIKEDDEKEREREREHVDASSSQFRGVSGPKPVCPPQVPSVYTSVRAHLR